MIIEDSENVQNAMNKKTVEVGGVGGGGSWGYFGRGDISRNRVKYQATKISRLIAF